MLLLQLYIAAFLLVAALAVLGAILEAGQAVANYFKAV